MLYWAWHESLSDVFGVLKLYQMDVSHAILFAKKIDISVVTADYLSAKFE